MTVMGIAFMARTFLLVLGVDVGKVERAREGRDLTPRRLGTRNGAIRDQELHVRDVARGVVLRMTRLGLEPRTYGLKV